MFCLYGYAEHIIRLLQAEQTNQRLGFTISFINDRKTKS